jgi:hypothetical protein
LRLAAAVIIKGASHSGKGLGGYLTQGKNERAEVWAIRGDIPRDLVGTLEDWRSDTQGARTTRPLYHVSLNPSQNDRALSREDWEQALAIFEKEMGFENQPRAIVFHTDKGREHIHVVYSRIDHENQKAISDSWNYLHHEKAAREIEQALGLEKTQGVFIDRDGPRPERTPSHDEIQQAERTKRDPNALKAEVAALYHAADSGPAFVAALEDAGYTLFHGNRNGRHCYAILDPDGHPHSLGRYAGIREAALRDRLKDYPLESLPLEPEARAIRQERLNLARPEFAPEKYPEMVKGLGNDSPMPQLPEPGQAKKNGLVFLSPPEPDRNAPSATLPEASKPTAERPEPSPHLSPSPPLEHAPAARRAAEKAEALALVAVLREQGDRGPSARAIQKTLNNRAAEGREMDAEQAAALRHATENRFAIIQGRAGTGKSFVLDAIRETYERAGFEVIGLAFTHAVVDDLREAGFTEARTLDSFLGREQTRIEAGRPAPEAGSRVLIVDEAGMVSNRHLSRILEVAALQGARVVLAGDDRQLKSIEQGGLFGELAAEQAAELTTVYRQREEWQKAATRAFAQGDTAGGLQPYHERGFIRYAEGDRRHAAADLVRQWVADRDAGHTGTRFVFSVRNADTDALNERIQAEQIKAGIVKETRPHTVKNGDDERAILIGTGDRIQLRSNDPANGIRNGMLATVERIDPEAPHVLNVRLDNGEARAVDTTEYRDIQLGYAGTVYRGQGKTLDRSYVLFSPYLDGRGAYVASTRAREKTRFFAATDDLNARFYRRHVRESGGEMPETPFEKLVACIEGRTAYTERQPEREANPAPEIETAAARAVAVAPEVTEARATATAQRVAAWETRAKADQGHRIEAKAEGMDAARTADKLADGALNVVEKTLDALTGLFDGPKEPPTPAQAAAARQEAEARDERAEALAKARAEHERLRDRQRAREEREQERDRGRGLGLRRERERD